MVYVFMFMFKKKCLSNVYKKMLFFISNFSTQQTNFDVQFRAQKLRRALYFFLKSSIEKAMFFIICFIPCFCFCWSTLEICVGEFVISEKVNNRDFLRRRFP